MTHLCRTLVLIATLVAGFAQSQDHEVRDKTVRRPAEQARDAKNYVERNARPEALPKEFRDSWLFKHEIADPRTGEERGVTLRRYVAEKPTREAMREQFIAHERAELEMAARGIRKGGDGDGSSDGGGNDGNGNPKGEKGYRSMYLSLELAERATAKAIEENQAVIEAWRQSGSKETLEIHYTHHTQLGVVLPLDGKGRLDFKQRLLKSETSVVRMEGEDKGADYVSESFPSNETADSGKPIADAPAGEYGRIPERINTSSGSDIVPTKNATTTILGLYFSDMQRIIKKLKYPKTANFGPKVGGFNVLNVPVEVKSTPEGREKFWVEYNKPFLEKAIERNDKIWLATLPRSNEIWDMKFLDVAINKGGEIENIRPGGMFVRELQYLVDVDYRPENLTNQQWKRIRSAFGKP